MRAGYTYVIKKPPKLKKNQQMSGAGGKSNSLNIQGGKGGNGDIVSSAGR